jgi:hypothetical protein
MKLRVDTARWSATMMRQGRHLFSDWLTQVGL